MGSSKVFDECRGCTLFLTKVCLLLDLEFISFVKNAHIEIV